MYLDYLKNVVQDKKICIFPMGIAGKSLLDKLKQIGISVDCFSDNDYNKIGKEYEGVRCISKDQLKSYGNDVVIIVESLYYNEIKEQLLKEGFADIIRIYYEKAIGEKWIEENREEFNQKVKQVREICEDQSSIDVFDRIVQAYYMSGEELCDDYFSTIYDPVQYFTPDLFQWDERRNECFVDCGAYTGDTANAFLDQCKGNFDKLHLFELDPIIYRRLMMNVPELYKKTKSGIIQCYPYGVSGSFSEVLFASGDSSSQIIDSESKDDGLTKGHVVALDQVLVNERVSFIKMDIEGAEMSALRGGERIIRDQRPNLAICIYHSVSDLVNIPLWIKTIVPDYKIYIRHHTDLMLETVCYAL